MADPRASQALELMTRFAERTTIATGPGVRRYLWTDAFAVTTLLGLARATGDRGCHALALALVDRVHHVLGRHRADDPRSGWLSGLPEPEGEAHPTRGGLRIGKPLPERAPDEPFDADLEWERDGQYFHYLTKWMHALDQAARSTRDAKLEVWARELAHAAHRAFVRGPAAARRMTWKLSVDLSRPLVPSMGHHDPLEGLVTCAALEATTKELGLPREPSLEEAARDYDGMLDRDGLGTTDPLGIGGLLVDAFRLAQLSEGDVVLVARLLRAAAWGLGHWVMKADLSGPAEHRLAFRELGLAIGLAAVPRLEEMRADLAPGAEGALSELARFVPLRDRIEAFWLEPDHRRSATWLEHEDIDEVMLATSLAPEGLLVRPSLA